jgi:hypothetical protein
MKEIRSQAIQVSVVFCQDMCQGIEKAGFFALSSYLQTAGFSMSCS